MCECSTFWLIKLTLGLVSVADFFTTDISYCSYSTHIYPNDDTETSTFDLTVLLHGDCLRLSCGGRIPINVRDWLPYTCK